ncbi:MAG: hypothetical protein WCG84_02285 [Candidatus Moraniibacteriota bacterium]
MNKDLSTDILAEIKNQHIAPEPYWKALLKRRGTWIFFVLASLIGAGILAITSSIFADLDWNIPFAWSHPFNHIPFPFFPLFWFILVILCAILAMISIRKTEYGYRYEWKTLTLLPLGVILLLGFFLWRIGAGQRFNTSLMRDIPTYGQHALTKESQWSQPENGLLAGTILSTQNTNLSLQDFSGKVWTIVIDAHVIIRPSVTLQKNAAVKIIGEQTEKNTFTAQEIRPWDGAGMMRGRRR